MTETCWAHFGTHLGMLALAILIGAGGIIVRLAPGVERPFRDEVLDDPRSAVLGRPRTDLFRVPGKVDPISLPSFTGFGGTTILLLRCDASPALR